jgi:propanol-preferring alcohol dehydrogenase
MVLHKQHCPLTLEEVPKPTLKPGELLVRVHACGVCRTDLHIQDGDLPAPKLPLILGHEIVGTVEEIGKGVSNFQIGDRIGIPWLAESCGQCSFCQRGQENLCDQARYTGYHIDGGFAEYTVCKASYAIPLPFPLSDPEIAPLLCAGLIGYRSYRKAAPETTLGIYGFGAAAHILTQVAIQQGKQVYALTRPGNTKTQQFARDLGAVWAGDSHTLPPIPLDAAIIFAPVGELVPLSLKALKKGGRCICGGIHMSAIPTFPYRDLWGEKTIQSVTNLTREDSQAFFTLISQISIQTQVTSYPLEQANQALEDLRQGKFQGAAVLQIQY